MTTPSLSSINVQLRGSQDFLNTISYCFFLLYTALINTCVSCCCIHVGHSYLLHCTYQHMCVLLLYPYRPQLSATLHLSTHVCVLLLYPCRPRLSTTLHLSTRVSCCCTHIGHSFGRLLQPPPNLVTVA